MKGGVRDSVKHMMYSRSVESPLVKHLISIWGAELSIFLQIA